MSKKQTAVDWLSQKYNHITWMRNRDEMSAETADILRDAYLKLAKDMEKMQIINAHKDGNKYNEWALQHEHEQYYNEIYQP